MKRVFHKLFLYGLLVAGMYLHFALIVPLTVFAQEANCAMPEPIANLVSSVEKVSSTGGRISDKALLRVRSDLTHAEKLLTISSMFEPGLRERHQALLSLVKHTRGILDDTRVSNPRGTMQIIESVRKTISETCSAEMRSTGKSDVTASSSLYSPSAIDMITTGSLSDDAKLNQGANIEGDRMYYLYLLVGLPAAIGLVFLIRSIFLWAASFFHGRMTCKIWAQLEIGSERIDGNITILGRRGIRFQPARQDAFQRIESLAGYNVSSVIVGSQKFPTNLIGLHGSFISLLFTNQISRRLKKKLLSQSKHTPNFVEMGHPEPNIHEHLSTSSSST